MSDEEEAEAPLQRGQPPKDAKCYVCDAPATCWGCYDSPVEQGGCDTHCGHGNEDGYCTSIEDFAEEEIQKLASDLGLGSAHEGDLGRTGWGKRRKPGGDPWAIDLWVWKNPNTGGWFFAPCATAPRGVGPFPSELVALRHLHKLALP